MSRGEGYDAFADNPELVLTNGKVLRGRRHLIEDLDEDLLAGTKMHLANIIAGKDITIIEADFENPPGDPLSCPPANIQVHFQRVDKTQRMHLYFAPRTKREGGQEKTRGSDRGLEPREPEPQSQNPKGGSQMRTNREAMPLPLEEGAVVSRQEQWGEMHVAMETAPAGMDTRLLFKGLPDDGCQCPH